MTRLTFTELEFDNDGTITIADILEFNSYNTLYELRLPKAKMPRYGQGYTIGSLKGDQDTYWVYNIGAYLPRIIINNISNGTINNTIAWTDIKWSPQIGVFCCTSQQNNIARSSDLVTWTYHDPGLTAFWTRLAWSPELGIFCAVGNASNFAYSSISSDGITWVSTSPSLASIHDITSITWASNAGLFLCSTNEGRCLTSSDGLNWTAYNAIGTTFWLDISYAPSINTTIMVSFNSPYVAYSTDVAQTLNLSSISTDKDWSCCAWSPDLGMFVIGGRSVGNNIMWSLDGINWTTANIIPSGLGCESCTWVQELGIFVIGGRNSTPGGAYSYNGKNWFSCSSFPTGVNVTGISWSPSLGKLAGVTLNGSNRSFNTTN